MAGVVLISAGGTGGHLFPAEALARALTDRGWRVHLATDRRAENYDESFPAEAVHRISSATLTRSPVELTRGLFMLGRGFIEAHALLRRIRPDVAVGFGGYPTLPPMLAASRIGVPTIIHEQNAVIGRANAFLAPRVTHIATGASQLRQVERWQDRVVETGNPIRPIVLEAAKTPYAVRSADEPLRLLVFGGSQGARFMSDLVPEAIALLPEDLRGRLRLVQQCRPEDVERVAEAYRRLGVEAELQTFFTDLPHRIADAHLVVSRSGASTCAELAVIGRPAVMVPLPHALDQDQKANAEVLQAAGGGWMIEQHDMTAERLAEHLTRAINDPDRLAAAAAAARSIGRADAVERLADLVERTAVERGGHQGVAA